MRLRQYYIPRSKKELVDMIAVNWTGTKSQLRAMDRKQLVAIFNQQRMRTLYQLMVNPTRRG